MRSVPELFIAAALALASAGAAAQPAEPAPPELESPLDPVPRGEAPTREHVRKALEKVADDPNLAAVRKINMLRWKDPEPATAEPLWMQWANSLARWVRGFVAWVAESGRAIVWAAGALGAALLAVYVWRVVRKRGLPHVPQRVAAPSHVRDLDIRPESLPDDVGAAAFDLWQRGEQRAALALLYRALLSRLVHAYAVPIRASSTEGECLTLALPRLEEPGARYATRLVETWAAAVYGGSMPATRDVQALCAEFGSALDRQGAS